jgi:hypothetical protein
LPQLSEYQPEAIPRHSKATVIFCNFFHFIILKPSQTPSQAKDQARKTKPSQKTKPKTKPIQKPSQAKNQAKDQAKPHLPRSDPSGAIGDFIFLVKTVSGIFPSSGTLWSLMTFSS